MTIAANRGVNDSLVAGPQRAVIDLVLFERGLLGQVGDENVSPVDEPVQYLLPGGSGEVERQAALVAVDRQIVGALISYERRSPGT